MDEILKMLDARVKEAGDLYRGASDDVELYLQGRWEEAQDIRSQIAGLINAKKKAR
jgi:hypothetical protein